jgi:hypothetical protein
VGCWLSAIGCRQGGLRDGRRPLSSAEVRPRWQKASTFSLSYDIMRVEQEHGRGRGSGGEDFSYVTANSFT